MKIEIALVRTRTSTRNYRSPTETRHGPHSWRSVDGDFDAVQTVVLCYDVINDNNKATRPKVEKTLFCSVHQCSVQTLWISDKIECIITDILYRICIMFAHVEFHHLECGIYIYNIYIIYIPHYSLHKIDTIQKTQISKLIRFQNYICSQMISF